MIRGEREYAPDYDTWKLSEPDDGEWGECLTCGRPWDQDGPRCDCEDDDTFLGEENHAAMDEACELPNNTKAGVQ